MPLYLYCNDEFIGTLTRTSEGLLLEAESQHKDKFGFLKESDTYHFFDNALPEGFRREIYAAACKTHDVYELLSRYGCDLAGDLSVMPYRKEGRQAALKNVTGEIVERIRARERLDLIPGQKMSLCGIDNKTTVIVRGREMYLPDDKNPSTHIIKASRSLSVNEWFTTRLGKMCGLNTVEPELVNFGEECLIIPRYDREQKDGKWVRLAQEDFCQRLHAPVEDKYCDGKKGISNADMADVLCDLPEEDREMYLRAAAFSLIVGNTDDHAKNYSLLYKDGKTCLAPIYDLVNVFGARKLTREWAGVDHKLSRPFGKTLDPYRIKPRDFLLYARDMNVDSVKCCHLFSHVLTDICDNLGQSLKEAKEYIREHFSDTGRMLDMCDGLAKIVEKRLEFFQPLVKKAMELAEKEKETVRMKL